MTPTQEIEAAEAALHTALLEGDAGALDRLLAPEAYFVDQAGTLVSRAEDLAMHRSGRLALARFEVREQAIRVLGESAVVRIVTDLAGSFDGQDFAGRFAYLRVWHRRDRRWRIEAAQSTVLPPA